MSATQDYVALDWIKGEITQTLERAQYALEAVAEAPDDSSSMRSCLTAIHQAHGTLKMVELEGPTRVASEMEELAQALMNSSVPDEAKAQEILMQVILQMPGYLDRIQREQKDSLEFVVPAINNLRIARGEVKLEGTGSGEDLGLNPLFVAQPSAEASAAFEKQKGRPNARKIRQRYQQALIALLKKEKPRENLNLMGKAFAMLVKMCGSSAKGNLFRLALAIVEGVNAGAIKLDSASAEKFKRIDTELKDLVSNGAVSLGQVSPELGLDLLALVHAAKTETPRITAAKLHFSRESITDLNTEDINFGPDDETLSTVSKIIIEELHGVTDKLDLFVRSADQDAAAIYGLIPPLEQIASTLTVVGMVDHQTSILSQVEIIKKLQSEAAEPNENQLLEMAGALLKIESSLSLVAGDGEDGAESDSFGDLNEAMASVIRETRNTLAVCKDQVIDFISSDFDLSKIQTVPDSLKSLGGGLSVINQQRSCDILNSAAGYIKRQLIEEQHRPELSQMDDLADAITSVDYYLERLLESSSEPYLQMIEVAESAVAKLGYAVDQATVEAVAVSVVDVEVQSSQRESAIEEVDEVDEVDELDEVDEAPGELVQVSEAASQVSIEPTIDVVAKEISGATQQNAGAASNEALVDDEILEIFIEEAEEVLENIREHLPRWRSSPTDTDSLTEVRRAFHTLKGSGRMVGATVMGEFAWAVENMLNRVMDTSLTADANLFVLLDAVVARIPEGIETFKEGRQHEFLVADLVAEVEVVTNGDAAQIESSILTSDIEVGSADTLTVEPELAEIELEATSAEFDGTDLDITDVDSTDLETEVLTTSESDLISAASNEDFTLEELDEETFTIDVPLLDEEVGFQSEERSDDDNGEASVAEVLELESDISTLASEEQEPLFEDPPFEELSVEETSVESAGFSHVDEVTSTLTVEVSDEDLSLEALALEEANVPEGGATEQLEVEDVEFDELSLVGLTLPDSEALETQVEVGHSSEEKSSEEKSSEEQSHEDQSYVSESDLGIQEELSGADIVDAPESIWDPELDEIFVAEAKEKIALIKSYAAAKGIVTPDIIAAFHTLKGSAGMAGVASIARIATPMEKWSSDLFLSSSVGSDEFLFSVNQSIEMMERCLGNLEIFRVEMPGTTEFVARLGQVSNSDSTEGFSMFDFENIRVLSKPVEILERWDANEISTIVSELEDAKAQALDLEQVHLDHIVSALLYTYENLSSQPDTETLALVVSAHEHLILMFDCIAASQEVTPATEIVLALESIDFTAPRVDEAPQEQIGQPELEDTESLPDMLDLPTLDSAALAITALDSATLDPADVVVLPEDDIDVDVLALFLEEAEELIEGIDQSILDWSENPTASSHLDNILRHLHTMKGGARLAGLNSLGEYTHNFETDLIGLQTNPMELKEEFFASLNETQDEITRRVAVYARYAEGDATEAEMLSMQQAKVTIFGKPSRLLSIATDIESEWQPAQTENIKDASSELPDQSHLDDGLPEDNVDMEILSIFIEEAEELLESIDQSILDWSNKASDQTYLDNLLRHLHTLKGGARLAGLNSLGEYSHNLESFLIGVQQHPVDLNDEFFAQLNQHQDEITRRVAIYKNMLAGNTEAGEMSSLSDSETSASDGRGDHSSSVSLAGSAKRERPDTAQKAPAANQEMVRVSADLLEELVSLAGETSITRGRIEQQISDFGESLEEMEETIVRIREQVRRLEIEAESRETVFRSQAQGAEAGFDELELDRYTMLQEISRSLSEGSSDMMDLKDTLLDKSRDAETLLHQQARLGSELQEGLTRTRMVPFARLIPRLRRIVRQISSEVGKSVRFDAFNVEGELDRTVLERIVAPLEHMLRNAVDHGIESKEARISAGKPETGRISLRLSREGGYVVLAVSDDGGGIDVETVKNKAIERGLIKSPDQVSDHEAMQFIINAGFSTAEKLTQISGRGVGMDVVNSEIKQLGGSLTIDSTFGVGTEFSIRIPFTVSINRALMVVIQEETYAVPLNTIEGIVRVSPYELEAYYQPDAPMFEYAGQPYRLTYMGELLSKSENPALEGQTSPLPVILARSGELSVALQVDKVIGSREVVVKTLGRQFDEVGGISGATVLGDGSVVVILDVLALVQRVDAETQDPVDEELLPVETKNVKTVLIVDDSVTVRKVTSRLMERQGWVVVTAKDGLDAVEQLQDFYPDIVLLDIEMPKMDGFEVLRTVRRDERLKDLPIIMITSRTGEKHKQQAFELGVNSYLGKPFQEAGLMSTIDEVLAQVNK